METLKEVFGRDLGKYEEEAEEISVELSRKLGNSFPYALTKQKRIILYAIVKQCNPEIVIETGVGPGVSSTMILSALERGVLHSIDVREKLENGMALGFLVPERLRGKWRLHIGRSIDVLPNLVREIEADIFLHDSEHTFENVTFELRTVWDHLRTGGIIFIDNLDFTDAPRTFAKEKKVRLYRLSEEAGGFGMIVKRVR